MKVTFEQIRCKDDSYGPGADEPYFAVLSQYLKKNAAGENKKPHVIKGPAMLSKVQYDVKSGTVYQPVMMNGANYLELKPEDADAVQLAILMFEEDSGRKYRRMEKNISDYSNQSPDWDNIVSGVFADFPGGVSWEKWLKYALKILIRIGQKVAEDDNLGRRELILPLQNNHHIYGKRQLTFDGFGSNYKMFIDIEK